MNKKTLLTCALIAAGVISQASADNVVYFTGSTAFRSTTFGALNNSAGGSAAVFDKPGTVVGGVTAPAITLAAYQGSHTAGDNANYMLFHGNINGTPTYIDCAWSGSEAGVGSVCNITVDNDGVPLLGSPETFLKADSTVNPPNAGSVPSTAPSPSQLESTSRQADIALADTSYLSSAPSTRTAATGGQLFHFGQVAAVTFTWAKNNNSASSASAAKTAWNNLVNISKPSLLNLFAAPQSADNFTGQTADATTTVYVVGRNKGSGTRANALNDSTYGVDTLVNQFGVGQSPDGGVAGNNPDGSLNLWPASDANGGLDNGYESGGSVATALGVAGSTSQTDPFNGNGGWIAVGYLGISDATTHNLTTANWLTEDGVFESDAAIQNGQYTYWGYENMYGRHGISGFQLADGTVIYNAVVQSVLNTFNSSGGGANHSAGIPLNKMNCTKSSDFSFPTHN